MRKKKSKYKKGSEALEKKFLSFDKRLPKYWALNEKIVAIMKDKNNFEGLYHKTGCIIDLVIQFKED